MSVEGVSAAQSSTGATTSTTSGVKQASELDKMAFLNLLVTQLRYQDPMNPVDDKEFIAQLAQFTALEQMTENARWARMSFALNLVGAAVQYQAEDGTLSEAMVRSVRLVSGEPLLNLGGREIKLDQVIQVAAPSSGADE